MSGSLQNVLFAFITTLVLIVLLARLAPRVGLVDAPNERKLHDGYVPLRFIGRKPV